MQMQQIKRSPFIGGVLGLMFPGLGFMYGGNIKLSFYYNFAFISLTFIIGWFLVKDSPSGMFFNLLLIITWYIFSAFGAFAYVFTKREINKRTYNRLFYYVLFIFFVLLIQFAFTKHRDVLFGYDISRIVGSVGSALVDGDGVVIDTKPTNLEVGDILLYKGSKGWSISKVLEQHNNGFSFLNQHDKYTIIPRNKVRGKVLYVFVSWNTKTGKMRWNRLPGLFSLRH